MLHFAVLMRCLSVNRNECDKERERMSKNIVKQNVLRACIDVPVEKTSFQHSSFSCFPADERQNYSANSESIGPDYFSLPVQRWAKCQQDARKQRAVFGSGTSPIYSVGLDLSAALLLYFEIGLSLP